MSIYNYSPVSPIREVTFHYANDRPPVALVEASGTADAGQLSTIRRAFNAHGWQCVPACAEGKQVLQVQGFKEEGELAAFLQISHFAEGTPRITPEKGDHPTRTWKEWLEDTSMKAGAWSYLLGDGTLLMSGMMSGRSKEITSGALYTAGGLILARYGNVKTEYHVRDVCERTAEFLKQQAAILPENCGLFSILKDKREGALNKAEDFLYRYPSQVTLGVYTLGAFSMLQSGIKHRKFWDAAYGANSTATKIASILIPEKRKTEEEKAESQNHGPLGKLFDWIQEKPLRVFGYGSMVSAGLLGLSAYREYKANPRQRSYIFKFMTAGTYLIGDLMLAMSSKDHVNADGKFDAEEQRRIEALAAETIVCQPKNLRDALVHQVAGFLSTRPEMQGTAIEISASIQEQLAGVQKNPWAAKHEAWQLSISAPQPYF